jgi:uncharacterized protein YndB with AHSA1/START domain
MTIPFARQASTRVSRIIRAPRQTVYRACLDRDAIAQWRAPDDMTAHVHVFEPRESGTYRISLSYRDPARSSDGKSAAGTDTFRGRFVALVPHERIVEAIVFESPDPRFAGEMTMTTSLADLDGGTEITILCQDIPPGIRLEDNEIGCRSALQNLAALIE